MTYRSGAISAMLCTLAMLSYMDRVALSFASADIAREFSLSLVQTGVLMSAFLWTYTLVAVPVGSCIERFGAKAVAGCSIGLWSLATILTGLAGSFFGLIAARMVMGAGEAASNPCGTSVIRDRVPQQDRGWATSVFNCGSYVGPAFCALIAGPVIVAFGWRSLFYVVGLLGFVWLAIWQLWYRDPAPATESGRTDAGDPVPSLWQMLRCSPSLWGLALAQGCNVYCQYLLLTWFPDFLQHTRHLARDEVGICTALPYLMAVVICVPIGRFSDRILAGHTERGERRIAVACAMGMAASIAALVRVEGLVATLLLTGVSLGGVAATTSLNFALLNDLVADARSVGKAAAFVVGGGNVFGLLAPIATGYIVQVTNDYAYAFEAAGALLLTGAIVILMLVRQPIAGFAPSSKVASHG